MLCVATVFLAPNFDPFFDTLELEITVAAILRISAGMASA